MKYNFDEIIDRSNNYSSKWDNLSLCLAGMTCFMWVADMDFCVLILLQML